MPSTKLQKEIYNKDFKWEIIIPEGFENVTPEDWKKLQQKGEDAIEKTYDSKIENNSKTIFVFKSGQLNYFESNYQPFDSTIDGNYLESFRNVNTVLYETFKAQMPAVKIDTISAQESIDGLTFQTFKVNIAYSDKMEMEFLMFSRLFGNREFTVNVMYLDKSKGSSLLNAWRNSKFGK